MATSAANSAMHRKALTLGVGISVVAHVTALAVLNLPAHDFGSGSGEADRITPEFEAIEVIELADAPAPVVAVTPPVEDVLSTADASGERAPQAEPSTSTLTDRLAELGAPSVTAAAVVESRPLITFSDLEPVADTEAMFAAFASAQGLLGEEEKGGLSGLLGKLGAALSGGGHCPTPSAGPLILR